MENTEKPAEQKTGISRRDFLKKSAAGTMLAGTIGASQLINPAKADAAGIGTKKHNGIDDVIKISPNYKRFKQRNTAFNISMWSGPTPWTMKAFQEGRIKDWRFIDYPTAEDTQDLKIQKTIPGAITRVLGSASLMTDEQKSKPGFSQLDIALGTGAYAVEYLTGSIFSRIQDGESGPFVEVALPDGQKMPIPFSLMKDQFPDPEGFKLNKKKWKFDTPAAASYSIKKAAKLYKADLVGIAPYDERWTYESQVLNPFNALTGELDRNRFTLEKPVDFGFTPKSVIVMAHEMDYEALKTTPSKISNAAVTVQYAAMVEISLKMAAFIRDLGYNARHAGNDIGLSIPEAIAAGLGEGSRMGMIITEEFGPRVRISKVYTDLELVPDKPKTFGVKAFCEVCQKCADVCPSKAISKVKKTTDPENKPINRSNNPGVDKWYNDGQKCLTFWSDNLDACGNCITACPYNKIDDWHHDLTQIATRVPGFNSLARYLDEGFGYGKVDHVPYMLNYWKKQI